MLQSMGSQRVGHDLATEQQQQYNYYLRAFLFEIRHTLKEKKKWSGLPALAENEFMTFSLERASES